MNYKKLLRKLNLPDAKLLIRILTDKYKTIKLTPEQKIKIKQLKTKVGIV